MPLSLDKTESIEQSFHKAETTVDHDSCRETPAMWSCCRVESCYSGGYAPVVQYTPIIALIGTW